MVWEHCRAPLHRQTAKRKDRTSGREALAAACTARRQHFAATNRGFTVAKAMTPFAHKAAWLKCALHSVNPEIEVICGQNYCLARKQKGALGGGTGKVKRGKR
jgi:hypothetical protein